MGLRIIDRRPVSPPVEVSEAEFMAELTQESEAWAKLHGFGSEEAKRNLLEKMRQAKGRLPTPEQVTASAQRIREQMSRNRDLGSAAHAQVDIATLLELL